MLQALRTTRESGVALLLQGAAITAVLGAATALVGALVAGRPAATGALVGTALVVLVATGGTLVVNAVAGVLPSASLLVALLTYLLQLVLLLLGFVALERSGMLGDTLDRSWVGGAAIGATLVWLATQVAMSAGTRIPTYDLAAQGRPRTSREHVPGGAEGGEG
jgi:ATP synthase protein I